MKKIAILMLYVVCLIGCGMQKDRPIFWSEADAAGRQKPICLKDIFRSPGGDKLAKLIIKRKHKELGEFLEKTNLVNEVGIYGITPLWLAIYEKNTKAMQILLDQGADPNASVHHVEPIMIEASGGSPKRLQMLLDKGGNPNATYLSRPCLYYAVGFPILSRRGSTKKIDMLLEAGADINFQTPPGDPRVGEGRSLLMLLEGTRHYVSMIVYLLDKGADPTIKEGNGWTIVDLMDLWSEDSRRTPIYAWLEDHGYDLDELRNPDREHRIEE